MPPIEDHPLRYQLANELHARPFPTITAPATVVYLAIKPAEPGERRDRDADRDADRAHLLALLDRHGAPHPHPGATHHSGRIGRHVLKWEQHTEFVTYTAFCDGLGERPFDPADFAVFPDDWLARAPGQRITAIAFRICPMPEEAAVRAALDAWFVPESLAVARVLDDLAIAAGDFRIDPAGQMRFALFVAPGLGPRRVGRAVQRLCEIETYKSMAMLGFARARALTAPLDRLDRRLTGLTSEMTAENARADSLLPELLTISAELESMAARAAFRFGATGAYAAIVGERITALRETRFEGRPTFGEFMARRFEPAMRTVAATRARLQSLSDRAARAGDLMRTRVDVERSAQNQKLLASMDRRAALQLRLQHTVEGLSVVAISYYAVSLALYVLGPLAPQIGLTKPALTAFLTPPLILATWAALRRIRRRLE